jgi:hypothetical protein
MRNAEIAVRLEATPVPKITSPAAAAWTARTTSSRSDEDLHLAFGQVGERAR